MVKDAGGEGASSNSNPLKPEPHLENNLPGTSADDYDVWLIRKPTKVSLVDLSSIKFPHKAKNRRRIVKSSRKDAVSLSCQFNRLLIPHVFIPTGHIRDHKDAMQLKAGGLLKGVVLISEKSAVFDDNVVSTNGDISIKQELDSQCSMSVESGMPELNFKIKSIRKKPQLPNVDIKQRLKAFGVIPKKMRKIGSLPNLINLH